jgi:MFS family permease
VINYIDRQIVFSMFPVLRNELSFTNTQLGLTGTVFTWVYSLSMPVTGRIADLVRRDRLVMASIALWSVTAIATGAAASVSSFLVCRALMGVTEALFMPAALGLIATVHTGTTRSRALAIFATGQFAGIIIGGWFGGWTAQHSGWRTGFAAIGAIGTVYAVLLWTAFRNVGIQPSSAKTTGPSTWHVLRARTYIALAVSFFMYCGMLWILLGWLANSIHERFHLTLTESGVTATVFLQAGSAVGTLAGGLLGDRAASRAPAGRFFVAAAGLFASAPFGWLALSATSLTAVEVSGAIFGLLGGLFVANIYASAYDVLPSTAYGTAAGVLNLVGGFAGGVGMLATGIFAGASGNTPMLGASSGAIASAVALVVAVRLHFRTDRKRVFS